MQPRIDHIQEKTLVGMFETMSLIENKTYKLFGKFMPRKKEIAAVANKDVLDIRVYPKDYYLNFNPSNYFTKWALVEVTESENIPNDMEVFNLVSGDYAVFSQKGLGVDNKLYEFIFTEWLPNSDYTLDDRPHFDVLDEKYQHRNPDAIQEIWIPIKKSKI